jgi:acyl CoA:acetate/3-ketoacid CoA transferase
MSVAAYNVSSGNHVRHSSRGRCQAPGVLTKVGLDTFVDPDREGCAMNASAAASLSCERSSSTASNGSTSNPSPRRSPSSAPPRPTSGNLTYEHEGAYLGGMDQALAAHNNGGIHRAGQAHHQDGSLRPHDVRVQGPGRSSSSIPIR